jgi:hypothetical protein
MCLAMLLMGEHNITFIQGHDKPSYSVIYSIQIHKDIDAIITYKCPVFEGRLKRMSFYAKIEKLEFICVCVPKECK